MYTTTVHTQIFPTVGINGEPTAELMYILRQEYRVLCKRVITQRKRVITQCECVITDTKRVITRTVEFQTR